MTNEEREEWINRCAWMLAHVRVPASTVYMGGEHNPRPSEIREATMFVNDLLARVEEERDERFREALRKEQP